MGSDRQSILLHENGKKHRDNMEASLKKRSEEKLQSEKDKQFLMASLKKMEQQATVTHLNDVASGSFHMGGAHQQFTSFNEAAGSTDKALKKNDMKAWQQRKEKRKNQYDNNDGDDNREVKKKKVRKQLAPDEGHYSIDDKTYLEGSAYYPIFEEEMSVEIWIGSDTTSRMYQISKEASSFWKSGIILKIRGSKDDRDGKDVKCIIAYLKNQDDDDETIDKDVTADRIRLILGSDNLLPKTIEESRLQLMGGEEIINVDDGIVEIDENTGLSTFKVVSLRKVAVSQEVKDERSRARAKRREEEEKEKSKEKEIETRKMEEAKHLNADDSALGAYDVWGKGGYKGISINADVKLDVHDTVKSLSEGKTNVKFKKTSAIKKSIFKGSKKKQNRRKTFADSDEDE